MQNKTLGNNLDSLAYAYNIRGWLNTINKNFVSGTPGNYFGMELGYDKTASVAGTTSYNAAQYNGNITGTVWKSAGDGIGRKYDFTYDNVNRLTAANFVQNTSGSTWDASYIDFSVSNLTYDGNGNILSMNQKGFTVGGSSLIDQLTYSYQANTNKLVQVNDAQNNPTSKLGDFHYTGTKQSTDYSYDANGNLILDNNKAISAIAYNYLNLPQTVTVTSKGTISYSYDAAGTKLYKTTVDNTISPAKTTLTTYIGGFVYQSTSPPTGGPVASDTLQFISHEEGRARWAYHKYSTGTVAYGFEYDFFEKDHLGNTRVVLTQQKDTTGYLASGEAIYRATESQLFSNLTTTTVARTTAAGYPDDLTYTNPNDTVFKVNGTAGGHKIGPSLLLKVMSGDKIDLGVQSYYNSGTVTTPNTSLTDVLASLATGVVNMTSGGKGSITDLNNTTTSPIYAALNSFLPTDDPTPPSKPKAYLNWILLDDQLKYVSSYPQSGAIGVGAAGVLTNLANTGIPITKNGFLYIWVSNETPSWDVFFDNLSVKQYSGPLLEETHYYPFGLTLAGISSKALKPKYAQNNYKYNGKELQNQEFSDGTGLEDYDLAARFFDPQIGRFTTIDPLAEYMRRWSPYEFGFNNPYRFADGTGTMAGDSAHVTTLDPVTVTRKKSSSGFFEVLSEVADYIPFVGSIKQIATGIADGDWKEAGMGVVMLGVDLVTAGEGGEAIRVAEVLVDDELKELAEKELLELSEKEAAEEAEEKTYQTYTKTNEKTGEVYSGRTRGKENLLEKMWQKEIRTITWIKKALDLPKWIDLRQTKMQLEEENNS